jgi:hypothetical protein
MLQPVLRIIEADLVVAALRHSGAVHSVAVRVLGLAEVSNDVTSA